MKNSILIILASLIFMGSSLGQVQDVQYQLTFNEVDCKYEAYLHILAGSATSSIHRTQGNSQFVVKAPKICDLTITDTYNPVRSDMTAAEWSISTPVEAGAFRYHRVLVSLGPTASYEPLIPAMTIHLFDFESDYDIHGMDGIQIVDNSTVPISVRNGFTLGTITQLYDSNLPQVGPTGYAEVIGPDSIGINQTTMVSPSTGGTWTSSDAAIATIDNAGLVTSITEGTVSMTYDDGVNCPSSVQIIVDSNIVPPEPTLPDPTGDPSVAINLDGNGAQGILIPRLTKNQRLAIQNPATGLLLFQFNDIVGFYYYNGTNWVKL